VCIVTNCRELATSFKENRLMRLLVKVDIAEIIYAMILAYILFST